MGGDGNGGNNFVATTAIASLRSLVNVAQKEERKDDKQKGQTKTKRKKL